MSAAVAFQALGMVAFAAILGFAWIMWMNWLETKLEGRTFWFFGFLPLAVVIWLLTAWAIA